MWCVVRKVRKSGRGKVGGRGGKYCARLGRNLKGRAAKAAEAHDQEIFFYQVFTDDVVECCDVNTLHRRSFIHFGVRTMHAADPLKASKSIIIWFVLVSYLGPL